MPRIRFPFSFDAAEADFQAVYLAIHEYYPVGLSVQTPLGQEVYERFPGLKKLGRLIEAHLIDQEAYHREWETFIAGVAAQTGFSIESTSMAFPCFSGLVTIEKSTHPEVELLRQLHFAVSFLGPFFTIFGLDRVSLVEKGRFFRHMTHKATGAPKEPYRQAFAMVEQAIRARFPGYKFLPHDIGESYLEGLYVLGEKPEDNCIYNALFNHILTPADYAKMDSEDKMYGYDDWPAHLD